jgi:hypothetical protein
MYLLRLLRHWGLMVVATAGLVLIFARARWYFHHKAIAQLALPHPESLTNTERRRLQHYFYGGTFLSAIFCAFRGRTRSRAEKHRLVNLAALAYFFDDLVDAYRSRDDGEQIWHNNPLAYGEVADDERGLALHFYHNVTEALPVNHKKDFETAVHEVFNLETAGRQQTDQTLTNDDLHRITRKKGGFSVLLFRWVHQPAPAPDEIAALYEFGALIQLCDDIFDVWFDRQTATATVPRAFIERGEVAALSQHFEAQVQRTRAAFKQAKGYSGVANCVGHFLVAITRVCLNHYRQLQQSGPLPLHDRKAMIVDMERWSNRIRAAWILAFEPAE